MNFVYSSLCWTELQYHSVKLFFYVFGWSCVNFVSCLHKCVPSILLLLAWLLSFPKTALMTNQFSPSSQNNSYKHKHNNRPKQKNMSTLSIWPHVSMCRETSACWVIGRNARLSVPIHTARWFWGMLGSKLDSVADKCLRRTQWTPPDPRKEYPVAAGESNCVIRRRSHTAKRQRRPLSPLLLLELNHV